MHRPPFDGAVEVDDVNEGCAFGAPVLRGVDGIFKIDRFLVHLALN